MAIILRCQVWVRVSPGGEGKIRGNPLSLCPTNSLSLRVRAY